MLSHFFNSRSKQFGPVLKLVLCLCISVVVFSWPFIGIVGSIIGGAAYGLFAPMFATFKAVGEGKTNEFFHSIYVCFNVLTFYIFNLLEEYIIKV